MQAQLLATLLLMKVVLITTTRVIESELHSQVTAGNDHQDLLSMPDKNKINKIQRVNATTLCVHTKKRKKRHRSSAYPL